MTPVIKLSSPETREFWEIPVLHEDNSLLAMEKPSRLLISPDRYDPNRPNLMKLIHAAVEAGKPWAAERKLNYLMNAHRLDFETSGVLLLAKSKPVLVALADLFGTEKPLKTYIALVHGHPLKDEFEVDAKLAPHPVKLGLIRVDEKGGKRSRTTFKCIEKFRNHSLIECHPLTGRTHQIRVHLRHAGMPIVGDELYGGGKLLLSELKPDFRLKPKKTENPLMDRVALHATHLSLTHPVTKEQVAIESPWPKDIKVALKYLRQYAAL